MVLNRLLRAGEARTVRRLGAIADYVDTFADEIEALSDAELRGKTDQFRERYAGGESLDDMLGEAFAVVREGARRTLGQYHYRVQLMGGAALHLGNVAEMRTGEGKTLVSTLPAYLNGITGEGVHVVTTNDYLARRDSEWMGRVHRFLGLEVGAIYSEMPPEERREAYKADITYGTNNEFGFDYLRDNMAWAKTECVQRGHVFAIVDEVDSILIDEARTPLIISGPAEQSARWYSEFARLAPKMVRDVHYDVDERKKTVGITEEGVEFIEDQLGIDNLYEAANTPLVGYLNNAVKVQELFKRDKDYIVRDGEILIVDEFTGRVLAGRRYNEGLHQAIEAKEELERQREGRGGPVIEIKQENQTLATITLQNYFRLYEKLSGMTGTAQTEAAELSKTYKLGVVPIPTNRSPQRKDHSDLVYKTELAKFVAVVDDIAERYLQGQPVLVGTTSVEKSDLLSKLLSLTNVQHRVLNGRIDNVRKESRMVAYAGRMGGTVERYVAEELDAGAIDSSPQQRAEIERQARREISTEAEQNMTELLEAFFQVRLSVTPDRYERAWTDTGVAPAGVTRREVGKSPQALNEENRRLRNAHLDPQTPPDLYRSKWTAMTGYQQTLESVAVRVERESRGRTGFGKEMVGSVTISTNMAGRGTDIRLGGDPERIANDWFYAWVRHHVEVIPVELGDRNAIANLDADQFDSFFNTYLTKLEVEPDRWPELPQEALDKRKEFELRADKLCQEESEDVRRAGGLYIVGTERHESRRIDDQLRGRAGRQGDPGESRFYLSLGDELMRRFNGAMVETIMTRFNLPEDMPIEAKMVSRAIRSAQTQVEQQNFEIRKDILEYDEVMNQQRTVIYDERHRVLDGENLSEQIQNMIVDVVTAYVDGATSEGYSEDWDLEKLWEGLRQLYPVSVRWEDVSEEHDDIDRDLLLEILIEDALEAYRRREAEIDGIVPQGGMRELERQVILSVLDRKWREHLYEMDYLKQGIGLRAMAQRDPKIEYKREGFEMFSSMMEGIKEESVGFLFNLTIQVEEVAPVDAVPGANPNTDTAMQPAITADPQDGRRLTTAGGAPVPAPTRPVGPVGGPAPGRPAPPRMVPPDPRSTPTTAIPAAGRPQAPVDRPSQPSGPQPSVAPVPTGRAGRTGVPTGRQGRQAPPSADPATRPTAAGPAMSQLGGGRVPDAFQGAGLGGQRPQQLNYSGPDEDGRAAANGGNGQQGGRHAGGNPQQARRAETPSRNAPCPCGSGRKYKQCHGAPPRG